LQARWEQKFGGRDGQSVNSSSVDGSKPTE